MIGYQVILRSGRQVVSFRPSAISSAEILGRIQKKSASLKAKTRMPIGFTSSDGYPDLVSAHNPAYFTVIGLAAGTFTTLSFVPQLLKTIRTRRTNDMSGLWLACFVCGVTLWLTYGLLLPSLPIIVANVATLLLTLPILFIKVAQRNRLE